MARAYLRDNLKFDFTARAVEGVETFYAEAARLGLAPSGGRIRFLDATERA